MKNTPMAAPPPVSLIFRDPEHKGRTIILDHTGEFTLGRDPKCDITLDDGKVSRVHLKLVWDGVVLILEDLQSRNGVFVNGEKVGSCALADGSMISIGPYEIEILFATEKSRFSESPPKKGDAPTATYYRSDIRRMVAETDNDMTRGLFECMLQIQKIISENSPSMVEDCLETLFTALPATRLCLLRVTEAKEFEPWFTKTAGGITEDFVMSRTFARKVLDANRGILIRDALSLDTADWGTTLRRQDVRGILGVPVFDKRQPIAILLCDNLEAPNILNDIHVQTLEFFAKALETVFQRDRIRKLEDSEAETEQEFIAARHIQRQIFTKKVLPKMGGMRWALHYKPALHVGGDFYDFHTTPDHVTWVVADVAGKGISAALVVSMLKAYCQTLFPQKLTPREMLLELNRLICEGFNAGMLVTAVICRADHNGLLTICDAGHVPIYLTQSGAAGKNGVVRLKHKGCPPIGVVTDNDFDHNAIEHTHQLQPGDKLCIVTDGVTEACDSAGDFFAEKRLMKTLEGINTLAVDESLKHLREAVKVFVNGAVQSDDVTIVIGQY